MTAAATTKLRKNGEPDLRFARREERLQKLEPLLRVPRTVDELAAKLEVTARAVYFLFDALEARGRTVARVGPKAGGKYVIVAGIPTR